MEKRKNFTSKIKAEIVLSLLRGEDPELIIREYGVTLADINLWRDQFIESGTDGFKRKPDDSKLMYLPLFNWNKNKKQFDFFY